MKKREWTVPWPLEIVVTILADPESPKSVAMLELNFILVYLTLGVYFTYDSILISSFFPVVEKN